MIIKQIYFELFIQVNMMHNVQIVSPEPGKSLDPLLSFDTDFATKYILG